MNDEKISVLYVQAGKYPEVIEIEDNLESMQKLVGGYIEEYMPFEDEVAIVCNEEGKINGLQPNRAIYGEMNDGKKEVIDIVFGDFFVCYAPVESEKFLSIPEDMKQKYSEMFKYPERFYLLNNSVVAEPYKPVQKDLER